LKKRYNAYASRKLSKLAAPPDKGEKERAGGVIEKVEQKSPSLSGEGRMAGTTAATDHMRDNKRRRGNVGAKGASYWGKKKKGRGKSGKVRRSSF